jgi:hypothetical protein
MYQKSLLLAITLPSRIRANLTEIKWFEKIFLPIPLRSACRCHFRRFK